MSRSRWIPLSVALAAGFAVVAVDVADARVGGGRNVGSRGAKTFKEPPATNTAPKAAPIEKSMTSKPGPSNATSTSTATQTQASRFGGLRGLLMGGLIAAGLASIFGIGALASVLGFILQFALIAGLVFLVVSFIRSRMQPALARATGPGDAARQPGTQSRQMLGSFGGGAASASVVAIDKGDLDTFERLLGEIQKAYSNEDAEALGAVTTPEMLSHFSRELDDNSKQGVRNTISEVRLLQGDLSEAWRENGSEYATVAMRYALVDAVVDRQSGRVVSGNASSPTEATELWTFRRDDRAPADGWQLSAIQQAA